MDVKKKIYEKHNIPIENQTIIASESYICDNARVNINYLNGFTELFLIVEEKEKGQKDESHSSV